MARLSWLALTLVLGACSSPQAGSPPDGGPTPPVDEPWVWSLPPGFEPPPVPADNPMSASKVALGRRLFYDARLSGNGTQSCASCHDQSLAFTDGLARSTGSTGETTPRSAMPLANLGYASAFTWANPDVTSLEQQALVPMLNVDPIELGVSGNEQVVLDRLRADADYERLFRVSFPGDMAPFTLDNVAKAIAAFERTIVSGRSRYDAWLAGDAGALSAAERRGLELFSSELLGCTHCHGGRDLSEPDELAGSHYQNTGLYNIDGLGAYPEPNTGIHAVTGLAADMGKFKIPTLRNIALTAPYMHDGSVATLDDVISHYADGGRNLESGPHAGNGRLSPLKSKLLIGFSVTAQERSDLIAFFEALTDEALLADPALASPP